MGSEILYTIGEAVDLTGVSHRTLRHYEDFFNLNINRDSSGNRIYREDNLEIINIIIDMKKKGMKLEGIKIFLEEKKLISPKNNSGIYLVGSNSLEKKEILLGEIQKAISDSINEGLIIKELVEENRLLREQLEVIKDMEAQKENRFLEEMRFLKNSLECLNEKMENKDESPWYKKIFK